MTSQSIYSIMTLGFKNLSKLLKVNLLKYHFHVVKGLSSFSIHRMIPKLYNYFPIVWMHMVFNTKKKGISPF